MEKIKQLISQYKLPAFLVAVIGLAFVLVLISMHVYYVSGTFQLDLSRPEYTPVRAQIEKESKTKQTFDAQGSIDNQVLDDFLTQYKNEADRAVKAQAYSNNVLSDEQLGL